MKSCHTCINNVEGKGCRFGKERATSECLGDYKGSGTRYEFKYALYVERFCRNCKYAKLPTDVEPCHTCDSQSHWEKKEEVKMEKKISPTSIQSEAMSKVFAYLNEKLFEDKLPAPMIVFTRNPKIMGGYYAHKKWFSAEDGSGVDEIAINANTMVEGDEIQLLQVLVHELVHQWQQHFGEPGRGGYHNREWADKCLEIGLKPMAVDQPDCETGDKIDTVLIKGGKAMIVLANMPEDISIPFYAEVLGNPDPDTPQQKAKDEDKDTPVPQPKSGQKIKYTCPGCGFNLWGKSGGRFMCMDCNMQIIQTK